MLSINNNLMANNAARNVAAHFAGLSKSVRRLSSGLRIGRAADDAAGLSIRELMRTEITALKQGVRNANDAISMIQTADGALGIIDEKLIRMKELSMQAATGTYTSDQRMIINQEFKAMAAEINRIANSTDFNGIKLLNGTLSGAHNGAGMVSLGSLKVHFGTGNDSAEDYYYVTIGDARIDSLFAGMAGDVDPGDIGITWPGATIVGDKVVLSVSKAEAGRGAAGSGLSGIDHYVLPSGLKNVTIRAIGNDSALHKAHINLFTKDGTQLTGVDPEDLAGFQSSAKGELWWNYQSRADVLGTSYFDPGATYTDRIINDAGQSVSAGGMNVLINQGQKDRSLYEAASLEEIQIDQITSDLVFFIGGHANGRCNIYDLEIVADLDPDIFDLTGGGGSVNLTIRTQTQAQEMLEPIEDAIIKKDAIRAYLGAMQNRLENTVANVQIQAENTQAAESRISDVDVATEMTAFARTQILVSTAISMLAQANSIPQALVGLLQ